uniref:EGF-like domain-containing protein n=1 Tax=Parastrongyloides trichosuri TaxID=131310 RepID=A0A0N4Z7Q3_PARTI
EVVCKNGGYHNWDQRRCNQCICPKGYYGHTCNYIKPLGTNCSDYKLIAENYTKELTEEGNKNCNYQIKSDNNFNIELYISVHTKYKDICVQGIGVEIRHLKDKGTTGLCMCGSYENIFILSESEEVYIEFNGVQNSDNFSVLYNNAIRGNQVPMLCYEDSCYEKKENYFEKTNKSFEWYSLGLVLDYSLTVKVNSNEHNDEEHILSSSEEDIGNFSVLDSEEIPSKETYNYSEIIHIED